MEFEYNIPVHLIFGRGTLAQLGALSAGYGTKALLVTGTSSTKRSGLLERAVQLLKQAGVEAFVFDEVMQNPLDTTVYAGAERARQTGCELVIALGGGSIMDAAKAIAFSAVNEGDIFDYIFGIKNSDKALPVITVPTTCGTGSEGNGFAVISNSSTKDKKSLRCAAIIPKHSIIDPELMTTMPKGVLAAVGFDALCHNMEAYMASGTQPICRALAQEGMRLVSESLTQVYQDYGNLEAWEKLTMASTLGGMVIHHAGVTLPHAMEHPASGLRDIVHGKGLAALTPVIYEETIPRAPEAFETISRLLGGKGATDCVARIETLLETIDLRLSLSQLGILEEDIPWMTENCFKVSNVSILNHPVVFERDEIYRMYEKAL